MVLNKRFVKMKNDRRAEMGVGTMIIFIAMVLVAAVAASVLISTANNVREQATQTGGDAITGVASGFDVKQVKGAVTAEAAGKQITELYIYVQLYAGSPPVNLKNVTLSITAGGQSQDLLYDDGYDAAVVHPAEHSPFTDDGTVNQGYLVNITVSGLTISPGESVNIEVIPAKGTPATIAFTAPAVLSVGIVDLR